LEKRNKLDPTLITSDICIKCQQCCYGISRIAPPISIKESPNRLLEAVEYGETAFGNTIIHKVNDTATVFTQTKCQHLDIKTGCTIYEKRPKVCGYFNCFERYNSGDEAIADRFFPKLSKILNLELPTYKSSYIKVKEIL
jgi:Fe-S-cluster containining protein